MNDSIENLLSQEAPQEQGEDKLKRVMQLAEIMLQQNKRVQGLEEQLKEAKEDLRRLETEALPDLMTEIGLNAVTLSTGEKVEIVPDVECGINQANQEAAFDWLEENGYGALISTKVGTSFGKDELELAKTLAEQIQEMDHDVEFKMSVHPARLKSFVKEQLAANKPLPLELFGVRPFNKAKYKKP